MMQDNTNHVTTTTAKKSPSKEERQRKCSACSRHSPSTIFSCRYKVHDRNMGELSVFFEKSLVCGELCDRCYRMYYKHKKQKTSNDCGKTHRKSSNAADGNAKIKKTNKMKKRTQQQQQQQQQSHDGNKHCSDKDRDHVDETDVSSCEERDTVTSSDGEEQDYRQRSNTIESVSSTAYNHYKYPSSSSIARFGVLSNGMQSNFMSAPSSSSAAAAAYMYHNQYYNNYYNNNNGSNDSSQFSPGTYPMYSPYAQYGHYYQHQNASNPALYLSQRFQNSQPDFCAKKTSGDIPSIAAAASILLKKSNLAAAAANYNMTRAKRARIRYARTKITKRRQEEEEEIALKEMQQQRHSDHIELYRSISKRARKSCRKNIPLRSPAPLDEAFQWLHSSSTTSHKSLTTVLPYRMETSSPDVSTSPSHYMHPEFYLSGDDGMNATSRADQVVSTDDEISVSSDGNYNINTVNTPSHSAEESQNLIADDFVEDMLVKSPKMSSSTPRLVAVVGRFTD